jgi:hypothetical protein
MLRLNNTFCISKETFRCSETSNYSANKNSLEFYTKQNFITMLAKIL